MAIYHLHVNIIGRSSGRSSVAAAAYRAGEELHNERDGMTHDYTHKLGVVHSEIMLPENAPKEYQDRGTLWNTVEKSLKRKDAQTAREMDIALPIEFDRQEQIEIMQGYIQENFVDKGMCADFAIHDKGDGNPHAHIMLTKYSVTEKGFGRKNDSWDDKSSLFKWRENWANICNERLKEKGLDERIDHRTLEAQGIDRKPTIHIGAAAKSMERAGRSSDRMREYREIIKHNEVPSPEATAEYMHELKQGYVILDKEITVLKHEAAEARHEARSLRFKAEEITERAEEIQQIKGSQEQARNYFKRIYHIAPEEAAAKATRLKCEAKDMERIQERLQDSLTPLEAKKEVFALEYQRQKSLAEISHDRQSIQDELSRLDKEAHQNRQSVRDDIARTKSQRDIDKVTESNFQEILKDVSPKQAEALIKHRKSEKARERTRGFGRKR